MKCHQCSIIVSFPITSMPTSLCGSRETPLVHPHLLPTPNLALFFPWSGYFLPKHYSNSLPEAPTHPLCLCLLRYNRVFPWPHQLASDWNEFRARTFLHSFQRSSPGTQSTQGLSHHPGQYHVFDCKHDHESQGKMEHLVSHPQTFPRQEVLWLSGLMSVCFGAWLCWGRVLSSYLSILLLLLCPFKCLHSRHAHQGPRKGISILHWS